MPASLAESLMPASPADSLMPTSHVDLLMPTSPVDLSMPASPADFSERLVDGESEFSPSPFDELYDFARACLYRYMYSP